MAIFWDMEVNMKKWGCFLLAFILITFSGCRDYSDRSLKPCHQPNTKWISNDGKIEFTVLDKEEGYGATGKLVYNDEEVEFFLTCGLYDSMTLYKINILDEVYVEDCDIYEEWVCKHESKDRFIAIVEKTTFFKVGEEIVFHKLIDDSLSDD